MSTQDIRQLAKEQEEKDVEKLNLQKQAGKRGWYVIHTYSGYEEQVAENLKQRIESLKMKDHIFQVLVPKEKQIEIKNGRRRTVDKKIFPGYVLVEMIVTDDSWYVVRNTPNVTGFIGLGVRPTPMLKNEIERIQKRMGVDEPKYKIEFIEGDLVKINDGPLKGFEGKVTEIDDEKGKIKVLVSMFGRETPVSLDSLQVKKV
ncbi:MAG: transcription termination/antitermination protein NusG [Patescibacteria group bacterium]